jgi:hypothetical protein
MPFPCADCALLNVDTCRITDTVRGPADECTLTLVQQGSLFTQSKRLVAADGSASEIEMVGATNGSQAKTILEGTVWYV